MGWVWATSHIDVDGDWNTETLAYDGIPDTWTYPDDPGDGVWTGYIEFYRAAATCDSIQFIFSISVFTAAPNFIVQVHKDGAWTTIWSGSALGSGTHQPTFAAGTVIGMRFKFRHKLTLPHTPFNIYLDGPQFRDVIPAFLPRTYFLLA